MKDQNTFTISEWVDQIKNGIRSHFFNPITNKLLSSAEFTIWLTEKTSLTHSLLFPSFHQRILCLWSRGRYFYFVWWNGFKVLIGVILGKYNLTPEYKLVSAICNHFKVGKKSKKKLNHKWSILLLDGWMGYQWRV